MNEEERYRNDIEARQKLGQYLIGIENAFRIRLHIIELIDKHAIATLIPCCGFSWDNNLVTLNLIKSIEKRIIERLDCIDSIEWENVEQFYE